MSNIIKPKRFVGLHAHSQSSTFDGLGYPDEHIDFVLTNEMDSWALTDHGNGNGLAHAHHHAKSLKKKGRKYRQLYGIEFYFVPSLDEWRIQYDERKSSKKGKDDDEKAGGHVIEDEDESKGFLEDADEWKRRYHLVVVARNQAGLSNLFTLVKRSYKEGFYRFPRIDYKMLKEHSEGLLVSTACLAGPIAATTNRMVARDFSSDQILSRLENMTDRFVDAVGQENFFLEIQFNKLEQQHTANKHIMDLSNKTGIPLVATADSHYCSPEKWLARELYRRLGRSFLQKDANQLPSREDLKCELYPKNAGQMWDEFLGTRDGHDFYDGNEQLVADAIERTYDLAWDHCEEVWFDDSAKLPSASVPGGKTGFQQLVDLVKEGLIKEGLDENPEYLERVKKELSDIQYLGFSDYFITMYKVFEKAKTSTILGPGRGSGAGSLVNFLIGITQVDPIKYGLLWERFLGRHKVAWPDIDTDAGDRDVLIDAAKEIYGEDNVVPVSNFNTLKLKSLIKDVSKFYGIPFDEVNALTSTLQRDVQPQAQKADEENSTYVLTHEDCMEYSGKYRAFVTKYPEVAETIQDLFMQNRSIGRHAGGVLICPDLEKHMPVISVRGELQTPWSEGMNFRHLEENGFLKFDFLGLKTLKMVEDCIRIILTKRNKQEPSFKEISEFFDENINCRYNNLDDQKVYDYVYHGGRFPAVFQFTQSGARKFCVEARPESIEDLATITSIYRPGPLKANVHKKYVNAKNNPDQVEFIHPVVESVLGPTYGFLCFQEQFMELARVMSGFTLEETDKMRKTLVKKSLDSNDAKAKEKVILREQFIDGAHKTHGVDKDAAAHLWDNDIIGFMGYGFNKSHAVSYAIDSYYAAWLMTHYEKEWLAVCLQSKMENPEKMAKMIAEVKQLGYKIHQADINYSGDVWAYSKERGGFVAPLGSVKGVGGSAVEEILANRPYSDLDDLFFDDEGAWKHSKLNKTCLSSLCKIEALSSLREFQDRDLTNHRQLIELIHQNYDVLRKGRYGMTKTQVKRMRKKGEEPNEILPDLVTQYRLTVNDWDRYEKIEMKFEHTQMVESDLLFPDDILDRLRNSDVKSVTSLTGRERAIAWFCALEIIKKKTKNGKDFMRIKVTDDDNNISWLRVWGYTSRVRPYTIWLADVTSDPEWGCSTNAGKLRPLIKEDR